MDDQISKVDRANTPATESNSTVALLLGEQAKLAEAERDWVTAERCWRDLLAINDENCLAHTGLAAALRAQGQIDAATKILAAAVRSFPKQAGPLHDLARIAELQKDWPTAEHAWREYIALRADVGWSYTSLAAVLRAQGRIDEAVDVLTTAAGRFPEQAGPLVDLARIAEMRQDWAEAIAYWRTITRIKGDHWPWYVALATALRRHGLADDAEDILLAARERFEDAPVLFAEYAKAAEARLDWTEAWRRWETMESRFPDVPEAYRGQSAVLRRLGRVDEAHALLGVAALRFPDDANMMHDLARIAEQRRNWQEAEHCWRQFIKLDDRFWWAHVGLANALREQGRWGEASNVFDDLVNKFPGNADAFAEVIDQISRPGGKLDEGSLTEIENVLRRACGQENTAPRVLVAYALIARERRDWSEYHARVASGYARAPQNRRLQVLMSEANELLADSEVPAIGSPSVQSDATELSDMEIALAFESLGGGRGRLDRGLGGCEFGFFQRVHGAEPLSLLRWASIEPGDLERALSEQFSKLGENDAIELQAQGHYDWRAVEMNYNIQIDHTHLDRSKVGIDEAKRLVVKRFQFLKRKLLDDLRLGEKIFVYRVADPATPADEVETMWRAVNRYGNSTLLFVTHRSDIDGSLMVKRMHDRLFVASIDPSKNIDPSEPSMNYRNWLDLCRSVLLAVKAKDF